MIIEKCIVLMHGMCVAVVDLRYVDMLFLYYIPYKPMLDFPLRERRRPNAPTQPYHFFHTSVLD